MDFEHVDPSQGEPPAELAEHFQGQARIQSFPNPFPAEGPAVFAVHFEAGGRSKPHTHATGQLLHIAAGRGIVGGRGGRQVVEAGDVVVVMPNEWHWHGGAPDSPMTHVTVQMAGPDSIDWDVDEGDWASDYEVPPAPG
ncbi:MAG: cupin domain-containing protein [Acidimicrobiales bacterium]